MTKTRIAAAVLAVPLLLTACGGDSGSADSATTPAGSATSNGGGGSGTATDIRAAQPGQAVDKNAFVEAVNQGTAAAKTYAMTMTMEMSGQESGTIGMKGVADVSDQANPKMQMTMDMPGAGGASSAGTVEMLLVDKVMYMKMPGSAGKYFKMSMDQMAQMTGQDLTQAMNPTAQLEKMKSAMKQVTYVGEEDVDGTKTRHYKAVIGTEGIVPSTASPTSLPSGASVPKELPYEIWLDDENRTRKFTMEMDLGGMDMKYDGTLDKFGEPVSIAAPPASQVQPMPTGAVPAPTATTG